MAQHKDPIEQWRKSLEMASMAKGKKLKDSNFRGKVAGLERYKAYIGLTPTQMLEQDIDDIQMSLMKFWEILQEQGLTPNSARTVVATVRGFYTHNRIGFPKGYKIPDLQSTKVAKVDNDTDVFDYDKEGNVLGLNSLLPTFLSKLSFRDKTIALCLLSSGQDLVDLLKLNMDFVFDSKGDFKDTPRFYWEGQRDKDNVEFKTFMSQEATGFLRLYVEQERKGADPDEPIFVTPDIRKNARRVEVKDITSSFYYCANSKMGIVNGQNPFRPKRFRHIFRTSCKNAEIDTGYANAFMGHRTSVSNSYLNKSKSSLMAAYSKVEQYVTVFATIEDTSLVDIRERLMSDITEKFESESETVRKLETQIEELVKEKRAQALRFDGLEKLFIDLAKAVDPKFELRKPDEEMKQLKKKHSQRKEKVPGKISDPKVKTGSLVGKLEDPEPDRSEAPRE